MSTDHTQPVILAVDDTPENLDVVVGLLEQDYTVKVAPNGKVALKIVEKIRPDLILLDIMMPDINGYEVCKQLKSNPHTADIPVIFLTAKGETSDEAEGFKLGAADYILKPVNPPILKARVKTHLDLKDNMDQLQQTSRELALAKERMEKELNVGQRIQHSMLPSHIPNHDAFAVHALMRAAREVGGDLYDYFFINPRQFCICIGDVSDKGVPAALFMAVTKTLIRAHGADDTSTASIVTRINDALAEENESCMFVTLFLAICDLQTGMVRFTNAGHNPPFIVRANGTVENIKDIHGPIAGAMEGTVYRQDEIQLSKGDLLFLYTDGVSEAMNTLDQQFTEAQIGRVLADASDNQPQACIDKMLNAVDEFADGCEQSDDITMLGFRFETDISEQSGWRLQETLINQFTEIDRINDAFNAFAEKAEVPMAIVLKVNMVFDELLNNIISYAYTDQDEHEIHVDIQVLSGKLTIVIEDDGVPFNPFLKDDPDTKASIEDRDIGGLGIHLVKNIMDEVSYRRNLNRNTVTLMKRLA